MSVLHEDGMIVHGVFPGGMEDLRNRDHEDAEGESHRPYPGGDRVIPSDLPKGALLCVHRLVLPANDRSKAPRPARSNLRTPLYTSGYTPLVANTISQWTRVRNLLGGLPRMCIPRTRVNSPGCPTRRFTSPASVTQGRLL